MGHQKGRTSVRPINFNTMTLPYRGAAHTDEPTAYRQSPYGYFPRYLSLLLWRYGARCADLQSHL